MVVLPAPVWPTMATVSPGSMVKVTSRRIQSGSVDNRRALLGLDGSETRPHMAIAGWLCGRGRLARVFAGGRRGKQTTRGRTRSAPAQSVSLVTAGEVISTGVSSSLKTRSLAAIADCRMLYFSLKS